MTVYSCENERRLQRVDAHATLNGIAYLEVVDGALYFDFVGTPPPSEDLRQRTLLVHVVKPLAGSLGAVNVRIEAPPRAAPVQVAWARRAADAADLRAEGRISSRERDFLLALPEPEQVLVVRTTATGDFSTYTLRLVTSVTDDGPPDPFDVRLAALRFSFKVACPSEFDCAVEPACPPPDLTTPHIDYLAKDYASFRRLLLDRLSVVMPGWTDRSAADLQIALVELLAYVGDHLSYAQDAVGTEAYLGTARRRVSLRRHARLLDYAVHEGCNARAWVHVTAGSAAPPVLPARTVLRTRGEDGLVFETMHDLDLRAVHNRIDFYTWEDEACCLAAGATRATLLSREDPTTGVPLALGPGDVLVFEETISPTTGLAADADPAHRHAVRLTDAVLTTDALTGAEVVEVAWHEGDALPSALCLSARVVAGGAFDVVPTSVARGNVVLADQGATVETDDVVPLEPAVVPAGRYRPRLPYPVVTFAEPYRHDAAVREPASAALAQDPRAALPSQLRLDGGETWVPQRDLLGSGRFASEFVVEVERDGRATLRFGDDVRGKAPSAGSAFTARYRVGNGPAGNVGAGAIREAVGVAGIDAVRNPLAATGGTAAESMEEVRQFAPQAFRTQQRAVTEADYAAVAEQFAGVQKAAARFRWTGSWTTVFVTVDRTGGLPVDPAFETAIRAHLDRFRLAGYDLEIDDPVFVPLDIVLDVCAAPGYFRSDVKRALLRSLSSRDFPDGQRGFFHPDRFTFGQPVYLSQLYEAALAVEGVASVEVRRFQRYNARPDGELEAGVLQPAALEVIRLDNDPSAPEDGKLAVEVAGGL
ncbi:MAG: putative baseplate assembly protein [Rhodothermales bacterium]